MQKYAISAKLPNIFAFFLRFGMSVSGYGALTTVRPGRQSGGSSQRVRGGVTGCLVAAYSLTAAAVRTDSAHCRY